MRELEMSFISYQINKALKRGVGRNSVPRSFISYQINKALKPPVVIHFLDFGFISYQINKALKPQIQFDVITELYILRNVVNLKMYLLCINPYLL